MTEDKSKKENNFEDLPEGAKQALDRLILLIKIFGPRMSVTQRAKTVKQPWGGYIKRVDFDEKTLGSGEEDLHEKENVHASLIGLSVDYLTRFMLTGDLEESFKISLLGSRKRNKIRTANKLLREIKGLDDQSIINAIKLTGFDVLYRTGGMGYVPVSQIKPDKDTVENVRIMVERTLKFFKIYGPVTKDGFTFEGGFTKIIGAGDGDFLTADTLWDLKVLRNHFTKNNTMQLLIYWRMGLRSDYETFKTIKYLGIYNPRKNKVFKYDLSNLSEETIRIVDDEIIGYTKPSLIIYWKWEFITFIIHLYT